MPPQRGAPPRSAETVLRPLCLAFLLRPLLAALFHAAHKVLAVFVERRGELIAVAVNRPRGALLQKNEQLVHLLFLAWDGGRAAIAGDDRFVRLAGRNEVDAVPRDLLVTPQHVVKPQETEREKGRTHEELVPQAPPRLAPRSEER